MQYRAGLLDRFLAKTGLDLGNPHNWRSLQTANSGWLPLISVSDNNILGDAAMICQPPGPPTTFLASPYAPAIRQAVPHLALLGLRQSESADCYEYCLLL